MKTALYFSIFLLLISACSVQKSVPLSVELKKQITMLSKDALVLGYVNVHQILNSPVYELLYNETAAGPFANKAYREFVKKTGFDLRENMQEMLFAGEHATTNDTRGMFVALGNFDVQKISNYIKNEDQDKKLKETNYGPFIVMSFEGDGFSMCFADSNHFVAGARQLVEDWLDIFSGQKESGEIDVRLRQRIERLSSRESMWVIMDAGILMETLEKEGIAIAKGLKNIQNADIAMTMNESLEVYSRIMCADQEKAEMVHDAIRGFVSSVKLTVSDDRDAVDVLNKIDVDSDDAAVTGKMKLNQEEIKKLLQKRNILRKIEAV